MTKDVCLKQRWGTHNSAHKLPNSKEYNVTYKNIAVGNQELYLQQKLNSILEHKVCAWWS